MYPPIPVELSKKSKVIELSIQASKRSININFSNLGLQIAGCCGVLPRGVGLAKIVPSFESRFPVLVYTTLHSKFRKGIHFVMHYITVALEVVFRI